VEAGFTAGQIGRSHLHDAATWIKATSIKATKPTGGAISNIMSDL
jgi:hypothetical protein